jgi:hypothetical protein
MCLHYHVDLPTHLVHAVLALFNEPPMGLAEKEGEPMHTALPLDLRREVAQTLHVPPHTVRTWLEEGTLDVLFSPTASPWIQCFPTHARRLRILRQRKKRHAVQLQPDQSGRPTRKGK